MQNVAIGWLVYDITSDPFALGLVGLVAFLPAIGLALVTGHVADRFDRRAVLLICYAVAVIAAAGLFACAWSGARQVWPIYALTLLFGVTRAFANPAGQALVPNLVPPEHFGNAVAWNSSAWQTATIMGPALGGLLYAIAGSAVFAVATGCFALAFALFALIRHRDARVAREKTTWTTLVAGIRFIRAKPVIFGAISLDLFAVLLGGATALLPIYARDILMVGPWGLGVLRSMPAVGAAMTALFLAYRPLTRRTGRRMFQAVGDLRRRHHRLRRVGKPAAVARLPVRAGRGRHGQRLRPADPCADRHAGRDARAGVGGQQRLHRRVERTGRIRVRARWRR